MPTEWQKRTTELHIKHLNDTFEIPAAKLTDNYSQSQHYTLYTVHPLQLRRDRPSIHRNEDSVSATLFNPIHSARRKETVVSGRVGSGGAV